MTIWHNMTLWTHLNYFKYACTLKLKIYNCHIVLVSIYFWNIQTVEFALIFSFFPSCKTRPVIWQTGKNKRTIYYLLRKIILQKMNTFFSLWIRNWCKQRDEKLKIKTQYVLRKLLFKTITVLTSIYFEPYCRIPARSNKLILESFYHKIHLHAKGILNQNKQI